ncbi:MAG: response regulator [Anaerolineales bacterium]|jgi:DNA-binding response OmpR family regulator
MPEPRALVADDDAAMLSLMARRLERQGLEVERAEDGRDALDKIERDVYDVIVTDIYMPGVTGLEILKQAKDTDANTQVVVVTAGATLENAIEALNNGAFAYLKKPFDHLTVFDNTVNRALQFRRVLLDNIRMADIQRRRGDMLEEEVTERVQQLQRRRKEMLDLLSSLPDGVLVVEQGARIVMTNPAGDDWMELDRETAEKPLQGYLEQAFEDWMPESSEIDLGPHTLELHSADLPVRRGDPRKVVVIKERCLDMPAGQSEVLSKVHEGLIWISQQPVEPDVARRAAQLLTLVDQIEAQQRDPSLEIGSVTGPWSEVTIPDSGELKNKEKSENESSKDSSASEVKLREAWIKHEESAEDKENE